MMRAILAALLATASISAAHADDTTNSANNPLTAETSLNLQNYYTPSFYGPLNSDANSLLLRGLVPLNFGGVQQLVRFTLPYSVNPAPDRYADGLGDLTIFDLIVLPTKPVLLAVGPLSWRRRRPIASPAPGAGRRARRAPPFPCNPGVLSARS